ncbi:hypothetical protein GF312_00430 [Candidatus Poribacteria bacterium]|nr:hypothetical protein [Candidatus Poribacteria bacterium]
MDEQKKEEISLTYIFRNYSAYIERMVTQYLYKFWELDTEEIFQEAVNTVKDYIFEEARRLNEYEEGMPLERFLNDVFIYDGFHIRFLIYKRYYEYIEKRIREQLSRFPELDNKDELEEAVGEVITYIYTRKYALLDYDGNHSFATFLNYKIQTGFNSFLESKGYRKIPNPEFNDSDKNKNEKDTSRWVWVKNIEQVPISDRVQKNRAENGHIIDMTLRRLEFYRFAEEYEEQLEGDEFLGFHTKIERVEGIVKLSDKEYVIRFKNTYDDWKDIEIEEGIKRLRAERNKAYNGFKQYVKENWEKVDMVDYLEIYENEEEVE